MTLFALRKPRRRDPPRLRESLTLMLGSLFFTLVGFGVLRDARAVGVAGGILSLFGGFAGLGVCAKRYYDFQQRLSAIRQARVRRESLREIRRNRRVEANRSRKAEKAIQSKATLSSDLALEARRDRDRLDSATASLLQERKQASAMIEADRLLAMNDDELSSEILSIFSRRGGSPEIDNEWRVGEILLLNSENGQELVQAIPRNRKADASDVEKLEASRRACGASYSHLIALSGFSPQAVRLASHFSMTLVEAHLLASWGSNLHP